MPAGQQHVQQDAQRIHIGRRRDCTAGDLFGRGKLRREGDAGFARQLRCRGDAPFVLQQFGDAEVQQLYLTANVDEHIRRFDIAMDDQVGMRI
jgi:hypothetical protein